MNMYAQRKWIVKASVGLALAAVLSAPAAASDWERFRGPNGEGVSPDTKPVPVTWSDTENLKWKHEIPGPGSSSPIVVGKRVLVTYWTGYGADGADAGSPESLRRHLLCIDRDNGEVLWDQTVEPVLPEDAYEGQFTQHGYASHTPVSDGQRVYVFFGKTGVLAFDLEGKRLWQTSVGTGSNPRRWGSASSPILYKNLVIVTAAAESESVVALDKETGKEVWRRQDKALENTWGTPVLVDCGDGRTDLVLAIPFQIWGINPDDGSLRWHCEGLSSDSMCASVIAHDKVVYALETGPRGGGTMAVRAGGEGDVTTTHVVWRGRERSRIGTPVYYDGRIYWISGREANCIDAETGKPVYQTSVGGAEANPEPPAPGGRGPGRRGGRGGQDYSSPVVANGNAYYLARSGQATIFALGAEFKLLAQNRFAADKGDFSATPAISDGQLLVRSSKCLYCISPAGGQ